MMSARERVRGGGQGGGDQARREYRVSAPPGDLGRDGSDKGIAPAMVVSDGEDTQYSVGECELEVSVQCADHPERYSNR